VAIESLEGDERHPPQGPEEMEEILKGILPEDGPFPPISAFSHLSRVDLSLQGKDPWRLLAQAGEEFQFYRSWGRDGKVNGKPAERNFQEDHDLAKAAANGEKVSTLPQRSLFGLPHNYFFSSDKTKLDIAPAGKGRTRRASPLWMHAHQFPDGSAAVIHTLLPAQFLPEGEPVQMKPKGRPEKVGWKQPDSWEVVERYLNRFTQRKSLRPSQGGVQ
jgi:CRISPR-associated protein Cmr1